MERAREGERESVARRGGAGRCGLGEMAEISVLRNSVRAVRCVSRAGVCCGQKEPRARVDLSKIFVEAERAVHASAATERRVQEYPRVPNHEYKAV